jgi:DNA helicase IV
MDKVFQEEQIQLAEIESKIDAIASRYERKAKETQAEIADFYCVDNDDRQRLKELRQEKEAALKYAGIFRDYQPTPYFGRLEVDRENGNEIETLKFLIGKEGISDSAKSIVTDWRSPMGACYYATTQREFLVNGAKYQLALRRALDIRNATLISYRTDYDGETVSLEGDVIDPFLLTVLKDKRRHNRLTDIIRTIQGNQNEIIRKPRTESFVVQGCAGSGKTMILLHRLSFLKFNNRNMSLNGVKIITPNKYFDAHINDLSVELGLTAIERFSVEEYYAYLIKRYSSKNIVDTDIRSEKTLSTDMLADIYSVQYLNDSIANYHTYWEQTLTEINESRLQALFRVFQITYPDTSVHISDTFANLELGIKRITSAIAEIEKKKKGIETRLTSIDEDITAMQAERDSAQTSLENIKTQTVHRIDHQLSSLPQAQLSLDEKISVLRKQRDNLQEKHQQIEAEAKQWATVLEMFTLGADTYSSYEQFVHLNDSGSEIIRRDCAEIIASIVEAETTYAKTPVYNFGKRNSLRKAIAEGKEQFSIAAAHTVTVQISEAQRQQELLQSTMATINTQLTEVVEALRTADKDNRSLRVRVTAWRECGQLFASTDYPDVRTELTSASYKECSHVLSSYEEQRNSVNRFANRVDALISTKQTLLKELNTMTAPEYSEDDKVFIADCTKAIRKLHFREISRNVMFRDLLAKYRSHQQPYLKTNFRHKLYLKLLFCSLYYTRLANPDNFLSIDEAQDISIAEYHLLRLVLGDRCVFNLYGDINQSVYSYKGISDWDEIADITSGNIYVLNENYRNTLQITDFCNKEFGAEVYAIGVSGEPVIEFNIADAIKWIRDLKQQHPEYRVAILHRHGLKAVQDLLHSMLVDQDISWYAVDEHKLSVVSVETAKGLEFEAVVAIVDQMSNNEKYISYTRALDRLAVVRDKFSTELDIDNSVEEIDDEFIAADEANTELSEDSAQQGSPQNGVSEHSTGHFYSWEIVDANTAIKTCDKSFFDHNGSGVPRDICWFFASEGMQHGESKSLTLLFDGKHYEGKVACETAGPSRMRITWGAALGALLCQHRDTNDIRAVFQKNGDNLYCITLLLPNEPVSALLQDGSPSQENNSSNVALPDTMATGSSNNADIASQANDILALSKEETALIAEFCSVLQDRFGTEHKLSATQQQVILSLYRGKPVACNAPSGSMKSVMLYLIALKEHQASGKQTLLTAEAHLQENELVLAEKLGLKCGIVNNVDEFRADFKKDKYDVIFVPYEYFNQHENLAPFVDYFTGKIAYWGFDHPVSAQSIWLQLTGCCAALDATAYLMSKEGFSGLELSALEYYDIQCSTETTNAKKLTFASAEERLKWLLQNLDTLYGQGIIYCDEEETCKILAKHLRKHKIMAEAYIDVSNPEKKERINYLTNSFSNGGLPVFVTTHDAGKNLTNPRIRFIIHYDLPGNQALYQLHIAQIGQLSTDPIVCDLLII